MPVAWTGLDTARESESAWPRRRRAVTVMPGQPEHRDGAAAACQRPRLPAGAGGPGPGSTGEVQVEVNDRSGPGPLLA